MSKPTHCPTCKGPLDNVGYCARCSTVWFISAHDTRGAGGMMADLTPDERAALSAAQWDMMFALHPVHPKQAIAIWRAARAYQAEQDAKLAKEHGMSIPWKRRGAYGLQMANAIRERAKGLT